jgi:hypothetical protein
MQQRDMGRVVPQEARFALAERPIADDRNTSVNGFIRIADGATAQQASGHCLDRTADWRQMVSHTCGQHNESTA